MKESTHHREGPLVDAQVWLPHHITQNHETHECDTQPMSAITLSLQGKHESIWDVLFQGLHSVMTWFWFLLITIVNCNHGKRWDVGIVPIQFYKSCAPHKTFANHWLVPTVSALTTGCQRALAGPERQVFGDEAAVGKWHLSQKASFSTNMGRCLRSYMFHNLRDTWTWYSYLVSQSYQCNAHLVLETLDVTKGIHE